MFSLRGVSSTFGPKLLAGGMIYASPSALDMRGSEEVRGPSGVHAAKKVSHSLKGKRHSPRRTSGYLSC